MKEIYVYKPLFGGWSGISKEEAEAKIKEGNVYGVELEMERNGDDPLKITLLKPNLLSGFGATDKMMQELADEYFAYVESITGMVTKPSV